MSKISLSDNTIVVVVLTHFFDGKLTVEIDRLNELGP
jgi:hypothetical protein